MDDVLVRLFRGSGGVESASLRGTDVCLRNTDDAESLQCRLEDFFARQTDGRTNVLDAFRRISWNAQELEADPPVEITERMEVQNIDRSALSRLLQCSRRAVARNALLLLLEAEHTGGSSTDERRASLLKVLWESNPTHPRTIGFVSDMLWAIEEAQEMQQTLGIHDAEEEITIDAVIVPLVRIIYDDWVIPKFDSGAPVRGSATPSREELLQAARSHTSAADAKGVFPPPNLSCPASFVGTLRMVQLFLHFPSVRRRIPHRLPWLAQGTGTEWAFGTWLGRLFTIPGRPDDFGSRLGSFVLVQDGFVRPLAEHSASHRQQCIEVLRPFLCGDTRRATIQWIRDGLFAHRTRPHRSFMRRGMASNGHAFAPASTLHQLALSLLELCQPYCDPFPADISDISIRYASQAALPPPSAAEAESESQSSSSSSLCCAARLWESDPCLAGMLLDTGVVEGRNGSVSFGNAASSANQFVDRRNLARQRQFATRLQRMARDLGVEPASVTAAAEPGGAQVESPTPLGSEDTSVGSPSHVSGASGEEEWSTATELVWLTARALHVGPWASWKRRALIRKEEEKLQREQIRLRWKPHKSPADHARLQSIPNILLMAGLQCAALGLELVGRSRALSVQLLRFYRVLAAVVLNAASSPRRPLGGPPVSSSSASADPLLPLPMPSREWAGLPEHCVGDVAECLLWARHELPAADVAALPLDIVQDLLGFCTAFVASPLHVSNPLLRFRLVEAIHAFVPFHFDCKNRAMVQSGSIRIPAVYRVVTDPSSHRAMPSVAPALLRFFVDAETTGTHTQFYDRFLHRSVAFDILDYVLSVAAHRDAVRRMRDPGTAESTLQRFASCLVNDTMHHGTSAGEYLEVVRGFPVNPQLSEDQQTMRNALARARQSLMFLSRMLQLFALVTAPDVKPESFLSDLMRDRVAQLLALLAAGLTEHGPERFHFTVNQPARANLQRPALVALVGQVIGHLTAAAERAHQGSVEDGGNSGGDGLLSAWARSFLRAQPFFFPEALEDLARAMRGAFVRRELTDAAQFGTVIERLCERIRQERSTAGLRSGHARRTGAGEGIGSDEEGDDDEGDDDEGDDDETDTVPDEFLDGLLFTVMKDPVYLPPSTMVVDRSTITRHLLDSDLDPFTRDPLRLDDVVPQPQLRQRIQQWRRETRKKKRRSLGRENRPVGDGAAPASAPLEEFHRLVQSVDDGLLREAMHKSIAEFQAVKGRPSCTLP